MGSRLALMSGSVAFVLLLGACTLDVAFTQDRRLHILAPEDRQTVELPFDVRWEVTGFTVTGPDQTDGESDDRGFFGLFFDRSPIAPGEDMRSVAADDESCLRTPGCPDQDYLNERNIYTTTDTVFTVDTIADTRPPERLEAKDWHEVTIVLIDPSGERIGESAFSVRFVVRRPAGPGAEQEGSV